MSDQPQFTSDIQLIRLGLAEGSSDFMFPSIFKGFHLLFAMGNDFLGEVPEHLKICVFQAVPQSEDLLTIFVSKKTGEYRPRFSILAFADAMYALNFHACCFHIAKITFQKGTENFFSVFTAATCCSKFFYSHELNIFSA